MQDFKTLKYADLQKHAKKAGIKANLKQEKLVAELTKFYGGNAEETIKTRPAEEPVSAEKSKPRCKTPVAKVPIVLETDIKVSTLQEASKPNLHVRTTDAIVHSSTGQPDSGSKPSTPGNSKCCTTGTDSNGESKSKPVSKPVSRWEKKTFARVTTPRSAAASPKPATPEVKQTSGKRKMETSPEIMQPAKKRRSTFEKAPTPNLSSSQVDSTASSTNRRSTFEKAPTPNLSSSQVDAASNSTSRRSTFEKAPTPDLKTPEIEATQTRRSSRNSTGTSPAIKEMLGAMKSDMTDEEMKQSLMFVLDKKAQAQAAQASTDVASSIPRFAAFVKKRQESKPITPGNKNWDKIHKKNFDKFDSIDVYLEKKRKRAEDLSASVKKARTLLSEVHHAVDKLRSHKTPEVSENKFAKPRTSSINKTTPFKPTVLNTSKMNLNFAGKKSPRTLPRRSPQSVVASATNPHPPVRKSTGSAPPRKSTTTPFKFTAVNTTLNTTVASAKKFDLKASLSRPITWKAYKGKLKPLDSDKKSKTPVYVKNSEKTLKERAQVRKTVAQRRADQKLNAQMARRGIKM